MDFTINTTHGAQAFNVTLLPTRVQPIFADMKSADIKLDNFTEIELSDMEAYLHAVADENAHTASLSTEPNEHGLSASKKRQWKAECIANTCRFAAAGVKRFNFARKNPQLRG